MLESQHWSVIPAIQGKKEQEGIFLINTHSKVC